MDGTDVAADISFSLGFEQSYFFPFLIFLPDFKSPMMMASLKSFIFLKRDSSALCSVNYFSLSPYHHHHHHDHHPIWYTNYMHK